MADRRQKKGKGNLQPKGPTLDEIKDRFLNLIAILPPGQANEFCNFVSNTVDDLRTALEKKKDKRYRKTNHFFGFHIIDSMSN